MISGLHLLWLYLVWLYLVWLYLLRLHLLWLYLLWQERAARDTQALWRHEWWKALPAVKAGRVYALDANSYFARPGPRVVQVQQRGCACTNPNPSPIPNPY